MLKDVELSGGVTYSGNRKVTFTTAETQATDAMKKAGNYFVFTPATGRESETAALISRGFGDGSLIGASGKELALTNIVLDGAKTTYTVDNGGIVNVASGAILSIAA